jgi:SH3-like domain-containing protein
MLKLHLALLFGLLAASPLPATEFANGTSDLPIPRFVSIKKGLAVMRTGPDRRFPIKWEYRRQGLPLEVLKEHLQWRQVRDPDGETGWMDKGLLTKDRSGYVVGGEQLLYVAPDLKARIAFRIAPGAVVAITYCDELFCRVSKDGKSGYILRQGLWGVYPREVIGD